MSINTFSIENLMQTPVWMMTGEQLAFLMTNLSLLTNKRDDEPKQTKPKNVVYGIKGIAETFGCSISTANRIKRSGVIDGAVTQVGRKIVVDRDLALELVAGSKVDLPIAKRA